MEKVIDEDGEYVLIQYTDDNGSLKGYGVREAFTYSNLQKFNFPAHMDYDKEQYYIVNP